MNTLIAVVTADAPRWLVLTLLGLVAASYAACGLLALTGHHRPTRTSPRQLTSLVPTEHPQRNRLTPARLDRSGTRRTAGDRT